MGREMSTSQDFVNWVCSDALDWRYLKYVLLAEHESIKRFAHGTTHQTVYFPEVKAFHILTPPLNEQRHIVQALGALDDKIESNLRLAKMLEEIAAAIFKARFVDFVGHDDLVESELGPIPLGWGVASIYDFAKITYGRPFKSDLFNEKEGIPLIRIRDLAGHEPKICTSEIRDDGRMIFAGNILVGMDGEFRAHIWSGPDSWLNQRVCVFDPREDVSHVFVLEGIKKPLAFFEATKSGTTVIHLGKADIDTFRIVKPPESVMREFSRQADPLLEAAVAHKVEARSLVAVRDALLPRLISGSLRIGSSDHAEVVAT